MAEGTTGLAGIGSFNRLALLAWSVWALSFVLLALGVLFTFLARAVPDPNAPLTIPAPEQKAETTEPVTAPQEMPVESSTPQQQ